MNIFESNTQDVLKKDAPLAARMRPSTLDEWTGQEHIIGKNTLLTRAIKADKLSSLVFYGPPGTGKTTLARIIAGATKAAFVSINATASGIKDIHKAIEEAKSSLALYAKRTILFIDEIHRFNKTQQDALLPHVEDGTLTLIGATTENPYFEVNKALVSRSMIFELYPLTHENILFLMKRALKDKDKGLGNINIHAEPDALDFLASRSGGDARSALNALELAALTTEPDKNNMVIIDLDVAAACIQKRPLFFDKNGDNHYDTISAFIKSMRGSDPDAALYYLARMIYAGEDPKFIARRIVICASEDVGNADPHALMIATSAFQAVQMIGWPESQLILAQAVTYIACAPKSNACTEAISAAMQDVQDISVMTLPLHLKDAHYKDAGKLGRGVDYKYPHAYEGNYIPQDYLPLELQGKSYYHPTENGVEKKIKASLMKLRPERY